MLLRIGGIHRFWEFFSAFAGLLPGRVLYSASSVFYRFHIDFKGFCHISIVYDGNDVAVVLEGGYTVDIRLFSYNPRSLRGIGLVSASILKEIV